MNEPSQHRPGALCRDTRNPARTHVLPARAGSRREHRRVFCFNAMPYRILECEHCGSKFEGWHNAKWCCDECKRLGSTIEEKCQQCGESFRYNPDNVDGARKYCSRQCVGQSQKDRTTINCQGCGEEITIRPSRVNRRKYCSSDCREKATGRQPKVFSDCPECGDTFEHRASQDRVYCSKGCQHTRRGETLKCKECGDYFSVPTAWADARKYCSAECMGKAHRDRVSIQCLYCQKNFEVHSSKAKNRKFCSSRCRYKALTGKDHPNWKGGYGDPYYGENWHCMRRAVRNRDCFRCRKCGMHEDECETELHVHHIVPLREFDEPEDANTPKNLVAVCPSCHGEVEGDVEAGRALL